jgi:hypothetical protein
MKAAIDIAAQGGIDVSGFVSATYGLREAPAAFQAYERDPNAYLRIVIDSRAG